MSSCKYSYPPEFNHKYVIVEQRKNYYAPGCHFYLCKSCGIEKHLEDVSAIEIDHQHNYQNYSGCVNGFYILRCTQFECESFLRIFNPASQACTNKGKRHLEDD